MFLARLPDGEKIPRVYRLNPQEITPAGLHNFISGFNYTMRRRPKRVWRYDSNAVRPGTALRSQGLVAIDDSPEEACMRIRALQIHEKYSLG